MICTDRVIVGVVVRVVVRVYAVVVLLLLVVRRRGRMRVCLILKMGILTRELTVMAALLWLLVHPWLRLGKLLLMGKYMLVLHFDSEARCFHPTTKPGLKGFGMG